MSEDERLSDMDRRSLRILARSSKASVSGARLSERLERAAETGSRQDYERAEKTFDSLPPEDRLQISEKAEKQAETERTLAVRRKSGSTARPARPAAPAGDDALEWKPIFATVEETAPPPKKPKTAARRKTDDADEPEEMTWKLGAIPGNPKMPKTGRVAKAPAPKPISLIAEDHDPEDEQKDWDWRKIPDDPVLNGGRKGKGGAVDPIEELRNQMLGLDAKYGKR